MNELLNRNYQATIRRGLITKDTRLKDYIERLREEIIELEDSLDDDNTFDGFELVDCFLVCASALIDFDLIEKVEKKVLINEERASKVMQLDEAIETLSAYNKWRRGAQVDQPNATKIGLAIDTVLKQFNKK